MIRFVSYSVGISCL